MIENQSLIAWLATLNAQLNARRHRALLWLSGSEALCRSRGLSLWEATTWAAPLWVGMTAPPSIAALPAAKARTRLGQEHALIVFDAVSQGAGFDPDAFGALSGTVKAGGLLVLLTPESWRYGTCTPDADYARLAHWPWQPEQLSAHYLLRLGRRLQDMAGVCHWPAEQALPGVPVFREPTEGTDASPPQGSNCLSQDQARAVERLVKLRRRRPLVLSADRGRGKTAALGIAAAQRLDKERELWITAPRAAAVEPLFERLAALLPDGKRTDNRFTLDNRRVRFLAPDAVLEALDEAPDNGAPPTLFVDEAAAIPAALLGRWLDAFPRIAFATTMHGYEGTGRGFQLRFHERLDRRAPGWRALHLDQPIRWAGGDSLETATRDLLLLDAEPADGKAVSEALNQHELRLIWLDRAVLATREPALGELFGLLVQAHYRTTPADLRQLLDGPDIRLLTAYFGDTLVGVCQLQREGGFPEELASAIWLGKRRPRGHLLAQSLAAHGGWQDAAKTSWWRIVRIAVHPAARRRGIGQYLVQEAGKQALDQGIGRLGVSFGADTGLLAFWRRLGFVSLRIGLTREAASGEHSIMMGKPLTPASQAVIESMTGDFQQLLPSLLGHELARLEPDIAAALLQEGPAPVIDSQDMAKIEWFAMGGGELALVRPWLARAWLSWLRRRPRKADVTPALFALAKPLFQATLSAGNSKKGNLACWRRLAKKLHEELAKQTP
ncbi:tRNA(Met) cytidine acetyltransferase TmcA [Pistricoccus aurantiacus]|uniref:tRNA(Met) cytidine acetyltransferase TmcA n=1 Tax=Pistricoccus aurantiacus TaxID=1883414 RepID=UPI00362585AB